MSNLEVQLESLTTYGEQISESDRRRLPLGSVTMSADGTPALYDADVIAEIPRMVALDPLVGQALRSVRPDGGITELDDGESFLSQTFEQPGLIIGFSGYGTAGSFGYETERQAIGTILDYCMETPAPVTTVVDGGTGFGVPGLSGLMARQRGMATIGYVPLRSLRGAVIRDTTVVVGEEFGDETAVLGATPDILIALGGGPLATKEIESAARLGSHVVLAALKQYPENSAVYQTTQNLTFALAQQTGRLVEAITIDAVLREIKRSGRSLALSSRQKRVTFVRQQFAGS